MQIGFFITFIGLILTFAGLERELDKKYDIPKGSYVLTVENGYHIEKINLMPLEGTRYDNDKENFTETGIPILIMMKDK